MRSTNADRFITDLLTRQTELIRNTITDLQAVREDLPSDRHSKVDEIIGRLQTAIAEDQKGLTLLASMAKAGLD